MKSAGTRIATVLPPSEHFTVHAAGAIGLFVRDTTLNSAYADYITVYGRDDSKGRLFSDIRYQGIEPKLRLLHGRTKGFAHALVEHFKKMPPGLIEVHNRVDLFNVLARHLTNMPISIYFHDDPLALKGAMTPAQRWDILARADAIYCCSDYIRRRFLTGLEAGRTDHVHVVYHGVDAEPHTQKQNVILYVGHLTEGKGALPLAQAAALVLPHFPDWRIVFAGASRPNKKTSSPYAQQIGEALRPLGKQAVFMGYQSHDKILNLFNHAAIAAVPSVRAEPAGRAAIEAMAAGCALITSGHGGLAELVAQAGLMVSPVTAQGLGLALQGLIEDPHTLAGIQQLCMERGAQFTVDIAQNYFDHLRYNLLAQAYGG